MDHGEAIGRGEEHSLASLEDGTVWTWGRNHSGQLGDGTMYDRNMPTQIQDLE